MTAILKCNDAKTAIGNAIRALSKVKKYGYSGYTYRSDDYPNTWEDLVKVKNQIKQGWREEYSCDFVLDERLIEGTAISTFTFSHIEFDTEADRTMFLLRWA